MASTNAFFMASLVLHTLSPNNPTHVSATFLSHYNNVYIVLFDTREIREAARYTRKIKSSTNTDQLFHARITPNRLIFVFCHLLDRKYADCDDRKYLAVRRGSTVPLVNLDLHIDRIKIACIRRPPPRMLTGSPPGELGSARGVRRQW